jgi:hypothetical protein
MTNCILYLSSCMKSSLFVALMIKFRQDLTEYKSSEKPMKTLHFSPLVLFLLHYEFIFTPMRVPWKFHGICAFELFMLKRIFSWRIREGHRTSGYSFVKLWRTKFMLLRRRNSDTIKAFCCGVNCGISSPFQSVWGIIRENAFQHKQLESPNSMEIPCNSHGSKNEFIMKQEQHQRRKM